MKVKTLIKRLEKYNQTLPVVCLSDEGEHVRICKVTKQKGKWSYFANHERKQVIVIE